MPRQVSEIKSSLVNDMPSTIYLILLIIDILSIYLGVFINPLVTRVLSFYGTDYILVKEDFKDDFKDTSVGDRF